jgi:hypothetical protein
VSVFALPLSGEAREEDQEEAGKTGKKSRKMSSVSAARSRYADRAWAPTSSMSRAPHIAL